MVAIQGQINSQLFVVRVWVEDVGNGRSEIRGQVKHILTGEVTYFREWPSLLAFLQQKLAVDSLFMPKKIED